MKTSAIHTACTALLASAAVLSAAPARALAVTVGNIVIVDNGAGDLNPANGIIDFREVLPANNYGAQGRVQELIVPGVTATLTLTNLVVGNTGNGNVANGSISFASSLFAAIGPVANATVRLNGSYIAVGPNGPLNGGVIANASTNLQGLVNGVAPIGLLVAPPAVNANGPVALAPAPAIGAAVFNVGVTQLNGTLTFSLGDSVANDGMADGLSLPNSADLAVAAVPEASSATLLLAGLAAVLWRRRHGGRRSAPGDMHLRSAAD